MQHLMVRTVLGVLPRMLMRAAEQSAALCAEKGLPGPLDPVNSYQNTERRTA